MRHAVVYLYEHLLYWKQVQMLKFWLIALFLLTDPALLYHPGRAKRFVCRFLDYNTGMA